MEIPVKQIKYLADFVEADTENDLYEISESVMGQINAVREWLKFLEQIDTAKESTHTPKEDFQHFLSYSGMWKEDKETLEKMFIAYCAALDESTG